VGYWVDIIIESVERVWFIFAIQSRPLYSKRYFGRISFLSQMWQSFLRTKHTLFDVLMRHSADSV